MENPFIYSDSNKRYYTYDYYMKKRYGGKCAKITLDCGFTCPNIDGSKGYGGCTYCNGKFIMTDSHKSVEEQFYEAAEKMQKKWGETKYIAYFQAFTNTYAPLPKLKELYESALKIPGVVGIKIATRADCISDEVAEYLHELSKKTDLVVELGLQTVHDITAGKINRCHSYEDFLEGFNKLSGIVRSVHLIDGLPGENKEMMLETVREMARIHPEQIKIHLLHILKGTVMERQYLSGEYKTLELEEYVDIVCSQLELLPQDIVIGRVTGDGAPDELVAPLWSRKKFVVMNEIDKEFVKRGTYQGIFVQS